MTFQSFTDLESPLAEAPLFFVEAKDSGPASELERQVSFRQQCRIHLPHVMLAAIPNASKRGQKALNQARSEGALWGMPDMLAMAPRKIAFLEFKAGRTDPAPHQIEVMNRLARLGFAVGVFRTADSAIAFLRREGFGG